MRQGLRSESAETTVRSFNRMPFHIFVICLFAGIMFGAKMPAPAHTHMPPPPQTPTHLRPLNLVLMSLDALIASDMNAKQ